MLSANTLSDYREFFGEWGGSVLTYCRLYLGDDKVAEDTTAETFSEYFQEVSALFLGTGRLALESAPLSLFRMMVRVTDDCPIRVIPKRDSGDLASAVAVLPRTDRAVFILRMVLGLDVVQTGAVLTLSFEQVRQRLAGALILLRGMWLEPGSDPNSFFVSSLSPDLNGA